MDELSFDRHDVKTSQDSIPQNFTQPLSPHYPLIIIENFTETLSSQSSKTSDRGNKSLIPNEKLVMVVKNYFYLGIIVLLHCSGTMMKLPH